MGQFPSEVNQIIGRYRLGLFCKLVSSNKIMIILTLASRSSFHFSSKLVGPLRGFLSRPCTNFANFSVSETRAFKVSSTDKGSTKDVDRRVCCNTYNLDVRNKSSNHILKSKNKRGEFKAAL